MRFTVRDPHLDVSLEPGVLGGEIRAPRAKRSFGGVDGEERSKGVPRHSERAQRVEESALGRGADPSTSRCARRSG